MTARIFLRVPLVYEDPSIKARFKPPTLFPQPSAFISPLWFQKRPKIAGLVNDGRSKFPSICLLPRLNTSILFGWPGVSRKMVDRILGWQWDSLAGLRGLNRVANRFGSEWSIGVDEILRILLTFKFFRLRARWRDVFLNDSTLFNNNSNNNNDININICGGIYK